MQKLLFTIAWRVLPAVFITSNVAGQVASIPPTGQYGVGRRPIDWTDSLRRDPTDSSRFREISGWVWYPAINTAAAAESPLPTEWQKIRMEVLKAKLGADVSTAMESFAVHARTNAAVAPGRTKFPVLLFLPGLSWLASDYSVLIEDIVSHGYVVVGISPTGFSDPVMFPDGRVTHRSLGIGEAIGTEQSWAHGDGLFTLKKIRAMDGLDFLRGRLDMRHIGAFGHSLGGTTSLVLADRDTTVRAAVNIDGDPMGDVRSARPRQPILLVSSESPTIDEAPQNPSAQHMELVRQGLERSEKRRTGEWQDIASQSVFAHRIQILGTHHLNFEDAALASDRLTSKESRWMKFGTIDPRQGLAALAQVVRMFFDQTLRSSMAVSELCPQPSPLKCTAGEYPSGHRPIPDETIRRP